MSDCTVSVTLNGEYVQKSVAVPSEDKGRTKHDSVVSDLQGKFHEVEIQFERGSGVLFLWYVELLVQ